MAHLLSFMIICFFDSYQTLLSHKIKEIETRNQKKTMGVEKDSTPNKMHTHAKV